MRVLSSVRFRTAAVAAAVVTVALVIAAIALVTLTRRNLTESAQTDAVSQAQAIADVATALDIDDAIAAGGSAYGQLIAPDGTVVTATRAVNIGRPLSSVTAAPGEQIVFKVDEIEVDDDQLGGEEGGFVVAVIGVATEAGTFQAVAASSLSDVADTTRVLAPLLAIGIPLLAALVFVTAWRMVGRSLAPIEQMRAEADAISIADLDRRIPTSASQDEVGRLADTLNSMLQRLQDSVMAQRRFVADASHELKSPIAALVTMAEVAQSSPGAVSMEALASDVAIEAKRLALLTDDLLALARSDEGGLALRLVPIDVAEVIAQEVVRVNGNVDTTGVSSIVADIDRLRLGQAIRNLVDNALRHAESTVWVATAAGEGWLSITVADDGPGVALADRARIFERFERLDEARGRNDGGSGLGLAVVKTIVEAHGGTVRVVDDPAYSGAALRIDLPSSGSSSGSSQHRPVTMEPVIDQGES